MLKEDIGKRIRDLRVTKTNLSLDDFAKKIGLPILRWKKENTTMAFAKSSIA